MAERIRPYIPAALLLAGWLLTALGYWGAWVWAASAGLRVPGIDLAEYVKFIAEVRSGEIHLTREVFLLPLIAVSLSMSLLAHRSELRLWPPLRWIINLLAIPVGLSMLPPAWTPALLATPEFVKQTAAIVVCVLAAILSYPLLRRLPLLFGAGLTALLALLSIALPLTSFMKLRSPLEVIYGHPTPLGAGPILLALGLILVATAPLLLLRHRSAVNP
ncbi:MAG: hypothetical protein KDI07_12790 [Anaerolineae bacterium]|nr:hypothetical protein [Anaerolineae bacterium]MCB9131821.1 hypothetical protein [Anaerolineales bacterium]MCB0230128.1 hypothetical protein [Anaerolineae bacterium]MCB0234929.1 hypothetical protein [Anaerolineae bacterium]MCB0239853.1 hypothetical protein [Anaerolineae bacterium]